MASLTILGVLLALAATACGQIETAGDHMRSETFQHVSTSGNTTTVHIHWNFTNTEITFEVQADTTGWIGIGFAAAGNMVGADIIVGWVKNGEIKVTDRHGTENAFPPLDAEQDIKVLGGMECDGWTMIRFSRPLAACEANHDRSITTDTLHVIWATGKADPAGNNITRENYHFQTRGSKPMYMLSPKPKSDFAGSEYKTFDITMNKLLVPAQESYYRCRVIKAPELSKKNHIVKYKPIIQKGNEGNVYFINVMACPANWATAPVNGRLLNWTVNQDYTCDSLTVSKPCIELIMSWGTGGTESVMPDMTGISIGGVDDSSHIMLEIHYTNPGRNAITDSSGIQITYTEKLRKHDSGLLNVGYALSGRMQFIPPGAKSFKYTGACGEKSLRDSLQRVNRKSLTVYQALLFSHSTGKKLKLRHIRNGVEQRYIALDNAYSSNFQEYIYLNPPVTLQAGDEIQMECIFNTAARTSVTQAGDAPLDEMCLAELGYYPNVDFSNCFSAVTEHNSWPYFGIKTFKRTGEFVKLSGYTVTSPASLANETALEVISKHNWTAENIENFQNFMDTRMHSTYSVGASFVTWIENKNTTLQVVNVPYHSTPPKCSKPPPAWIQSMASDKCPNGTTKTAVHAQTCFLLALFVASMLM